MADKPDSVIKPTFDSKSTGPTPVIDATELPHARPFPFGKDFVESPGWPISKPPPKPSGPGR